MLEEEGITNQQRLVVSAIAVIEREIRRLKVDLEHTEISLPVDARIDAVMVQHDEFVSVSSVLLEATEVEN